MADVRFLAFDTRYGRPLTVQPGQHLYIIGSTGTGKTTLMRTLAAQDLHEGAGIALIDPHGDMARQIESDRYRKDLTVLDATRGDGLGYNPLKAVPPAWRSLVAGGVLEVFKKAWPDAWGVRMEHILRHALLALLDQPSATLEDILRLLRDQKFRKQVASNVKHEPVRRFWQKEFYGSRDAVGPIENKIGAFLADPLVYGIVCKPERELSFRRTMDEGKALLINLAKGRIGEDSSSILGGLFVTAIGLAAFSRADIAEEDRRPFTLYIDEFQNYTTLAVADMLSELRKYKVSMVMAHQYLDQLDPKVRHAVLGNVASIVSFRLGPRDAKTLESYYAAPYTAEDLMVLRDHELLVYQVVDGCPQYPRRAWSMRPEEVFGEHRRRFHIEVAERKRKARKQECWRARDRDWSFPSVFFGQHDRQDPNR